MLLLKWFLSIAMRIYTAHDFRVIILVRAHQHV